VQKSSLILSVKVKSQRSRSQDKKRKTAESFPLTVHSKSCAVGSTQQAATDDIIAWPPGGDGLRRWENQRMVTSYCQVIASEGLSF